MLLLFLAIPTRAEILELTESTFFTYVANNLAAIVKFYSSGCSICKKTAAMYEETSKLFTDVVFAQVDCALYEPTCKLFEAKHWPELRLFLPYNRTAIHFGGTRSVDTITDFIEHYTFSKSLRPTTKFAQLYPPEIPRLIRPGRHCGLVLFYDSYKEHSRSFAHSLKEMTSIYEFETYITMNWFNCLKYPEPCTKLNITEFPRIMRYNSTAWKTYNGSHRLDWMVNFVNLECGAERAVDGMLNDRAGTIRAADEIAQEFIIAEDKESVIEKMKKVKGSAFYVKVMERYIAKGAEQLLKDVELMEATFAKRTVVSPALDAMKRKYNVCRKFLTTPPPPEEEPKEENKPEIDPLAENATETETEGARDSAL
jgi:protein disulfide-isomerase A6